MLRRFRAMLKARDGLAAVEFAFLAPVMIVLFFGTVEVTTAVDCNTRVRDVAATAADLVAQETTVSSTDISNVFSALDAIMYPNSTTNLKVVISSLVDNGKGGATVAWSDATSNTTARTVGSTITVPTGLITSGGSVIYAEVQYNFGVSGAAFLTNTLTMSSNFYARPRRSATVTHT
ncbi:MAG: pilus assembly protein [Alphaproteobacteria bacterium]|nr:pilus assembly protein [Alphaproteobacteria bacterium]MDE2112787.1 pilus assembly protein [Alphaproteobacteria bacterium]